MNLRQLPLLVLQHLDQLLVQLSATPVATWRIGSFWRSRTRCISVSPPHVWNAARRRARRDQPPCCVWLQQLDQLLVQLAAISPCVW